MTGRSRFRLGDRARSMGFAVRGIGVMLSTQPNAWIHATASVSVVLAGIGFGLGLSEWCAIVAAIAGVWTAEALNTAFEFLADLVSPEFHPLAEKAKDVAAGAVLIAAAGAAVIGLLVFVPCVLRCVGQ